MPPIPVFKRGIAPVLTASPKVIFDASELQFVDSTGLGTIVSCLKMLNGSGGDLKLCGMSKSIRALFELVRMHVDLRHLQLQRGSCRRLSGTIVATATLREI